MTCGICGNVPGNRTHTVREMMFGLGDMFQYTECAACGCLELDNAPADMSKYYPPNYYSLSSSPMALFRNPIKNVTKRLRVKYAVTNRGLLGKALYTRTPDINLRSLLRAGVATRSKIVDVGCGTGRLLLMLRNAGFRNVLGVDPYVDSTIKYPNGVTILKQSIAELDGQWDLIMFHHAFEHVPNPAETLQSVARLLAPDGTCLIRIPVASCFAWKHYGTNWVQIDAPRHYFLHTPESMKVVASQAGLVIEDISYDSTEFQFWGSEQYMRGIPLESDKSYKVDPARSIFPPAEIEAFRSRAADLNRQGQGDTAAFYLRKGRP